MKKIHLKIFPKTFIGSLSLIIAIIIIAFFLISVLTPRFYRAYKEEVLNSDFNALMSLIDKKDISEITSHLEQFAAMHEYGITLRDEEGYIFFSRIFGVSVSQTQPQLPELPVTGDFSDDGGISGELIIERESVVGDERSGSGGMTITTEIISESRTLNDATGQTLTLNLSSSLQPIDEANTVLYRVLPYALLISIALGAIVSLIYAKTITAPIKAISKAAIRMRALEKDAGCEIKSKDEIGELAGNINELYGRLLATINNLQNEIQNTAAADKEKLDFMLTVSHELKTPLTAVKGMIEGMIHNVGVYQDRDEYLNRCGENIDALTTLVNEILDASKLEMSPSADDYADTTILYLVQDIMATYEMIALAKQVRIEIDIDKNIKKSVPVWLFSKALSNIISNAVKYSETGGLVKIYADTDAQCAPLLVVENNCIPLSAEELHHVFEPLYSTGDGHGLGLYLTERILKVCGLPFEFVPFERGMRFIVFLK